jgi:hypothetical protein
MSDLQKWSQGAWRRCTARFAEAGDFQASMWEPVRLNSGRGKHAWRLALGGTLIQGGVSERYAALAVRTL